MSQYWLDMCSKIKFEHYILFIMQHNMQQLTLYLSIIPFSIWGSVHCSCILVSLITIAVRFLGALGAKQNLILTQYIVHAYYHLVFGKW